MTFFTTGAPIRPFPEFFQSAHEMNTQLLAHLHAANVGVDSRDDKVWKELLWWNAVHDPSEPRDVVAQELDDILLQPVQVIERCRVRPAVDLEVMRIVAFHLFSGTTMGVGAGAHVPGLP